jgi:hypothetical protein
MARWVGFFRIGLGLFRRWHPVPSNRGEPDCGDQWDDFARTFIDDPHRRG